MNRKPWLSVLMPTYNGSLYVREALDSVAAQDDPALEVIAVDDGSSDDTVDILRSFSSRLPIRVEVLPHGGNWVRNVMAALEMATATWVSILHQDDGWSPGRLSRLRDLLAESPGAVAALHPVRLVDEAGKSLGTWRCPLPSFPEVAAASVVVERLLVQNFISIVAPLFRRATALAAGGLSEDLWYTADWDLWLRMARSGPFLYSRRPLGFFRVHPSSQTFSGRRNPGEIRKQLEAVLASEQSRPFDATEARREAVLRAARFSLEVNVILFGGMKTGDSSMKRFCRLALHLGPSGWLRFLRDSRIIERAVARFRALLRSRRGEKL